jgi:hypothetical protein
MTNKYNIHCIVSRPYIYGTIMADSVTYAEARKLVARLLWRKRERSYLSARILRRGNTYEIKGSELEEMVVIMPA